MLKRKKSKWPSVCVIVLTYNSQKHIKECLTSVYKSDYPRFTVLVVDSASKDETLGVVKKNFPKTRIIASPENLGYAAGNNLGIKKSAEDYAFVLNPDTVVEKDCLAKLVKASESDIEIASCQPKVMLYERRGLINTSQTIVNFLGFAWCGDFKKPKSAAKTGKIDFFSGSAVLLKRGILEKIGLFDEDFFMYHEDVDLAWRINLAGFKNYLVADALVYHKYSYRPKENYQKPKEKLYHLEKNRLMTLLKNLETRTIFLVLPALIFAEAALVIYSFLGGWFREKISGYVFILKNWERIFKKRKKTQALRIKNDHFLKKTLWGRIEFEEISNPFLRYFANPALEIYWFFERKLI